MTYNLLIVGEPDHDALAEALAGLAGVPVSAVDVAGEDDDDRDWDAAVLVTRAPRAGDVREAVEIYLGESGGQPSEAEAASRLAQALRTPVLYPAEEPPPSAFWLATPTGRRVRARLDATDDDDPPAVRIAAVEYPVAALPGVPVLPLPEVIREHRMPTPLTDRVREHLGADSDQVLWHAITRLGAWEAMVARMGLGWPPDGWYPATYYRDDLQTRDLLTASAASLPEDARPPLAEALTEVDAAYRRLTHDDSGAALAAALAEAALEVPADRWWWRRIPRPVPWETQPGG